MYSLAVLVFLFFNDDLKIIIYEGLQPNDKKIKKLFFLLLLYFNATMILYSRNKLRYFIAIHLKYISHRFQLVVD